MRRNILTTALLITALATPALGGSGDGGGDVKNVLPSVTSLNGDKGTIENPEAHTEIFTIVVHDANGEADIHEVKITSDHPDGPTATFSFTTASCASPPPGWNCLDAVTGDGDLELTYTHTWPAEAAAGTANQTACAKDEAAYDCTGARIDTETTQIVAAARTTGTDNGSGNVPVYDANGIPVSENWGRWTADPGDANIASTNYLQARNDGTKTDVVTVSFGTAAFTNPTGSISIDGNIRFCTAKADSNLGKTPAIHTLEGSWTCGSTDADGDASFTVPAKQTLWIHFQIVQVPAVVPDGAYEATYTYS